MIAPRLGQVEVGGLVAARRAEQIEGQRQQPGDGARAQGRATGARRATDPVLQSISIDDVITCGDTPVEAFSA